LRIDKSPPPYSSPLPTAGRHLWGEDRRGDLSELIIPPYPPEAVKKLLQVERAGGDIKKVLERYLFGLTAYNEKLQ